jgi:hypothetical protein
MLLPHPNLYQKDDQLRAGFSFRPYINFLRRRADASSKSPELYKYIISRLEAHDELHGADLSPENVLTAHGDLLQLVIASLYTITSSLDLDHLQISLPYRFAVMYESHRDNILYHSDSEGNIIFRNNEDHKRIIDEYAFLAYRKILHKFYHFGLPAVLHLNTGVTRTRYYREIIDESFIDVRCDGELPMFPACLKYPEIEKADMQKLREELPLDMFRFEGFLVKKISDISREKAIDEVKNALIDMHTNEMQGYQRLKESAEVLIGDEQAFVSITPFIRLNSHYILSRKYAERSLLFGSMNTEDEQEQLYDRLGNHFRNEKTDLVFSDLADLPGNTSLERAVVSTSFRNYLIRPVFEHDVLLGFLELGHKGDRDPRQLLEQVEVLTPYLLLALRSSIRDFHNRLSKLVREHYTGIRPAVEWKFSENAWKFMRNKEKGLDPEIETVSFCDVYPIFGMVDIRNSSGERSQCVQKDLVGQLEMIQDTLEKMLVHVDGQEKEHLQNLLFKNESMRVKVVTVLQAEDEMRVSDYLEHEIKSFFKHFSKGRPKIEEPAREYLHSIDPLNGYLYRNRRDYDVSMNMVNNTISKFLDEEDVKQQRFFPHYFDKFRTDGIEYNIFVGSSIARGKLFDFIYLKNLRLWQLSAMAEIARVTNELQNQILIPLQTTQLILVHSNPICITFRNDEKKFDVEGGANIRYELIKKRIDKVKIRETGERLTQPGTIAIVYTQSREAQEYEEYIHILWKKGLLNKDIELLDLEDVQGVSGLKALRVIVNY